MNGSEMVEMGTFDESSMTAFNSLKENLLHMIHIA